LRFLRKNRNAVKSKRFIISMAQQATITKNGI